MPQLHVYGTVSSKITLDFWVVFLFSLNSKELLSHGPYAFQIELSNINLLSTEFIRFNVERYFSFACEAGKFEKVSQE